MCFYNSKREKALEFSRENKNTEARDAILAIGPQTQRLTTALDKHMEYNIKLSDEGAKNAQEIKSTSMMIQTVISIGAILHDFYYKPWQDSKEKRSFFKQHGFVHAKEALENSRKHFPRLINDRVENIILRHMFPLNITPPKYKETWVVTLMDKKCSLNVFKHPKEWPKYIGIKRKVKK